MGSLNFVDLTNLYLPRVRKKQKRSERDQQILASICIHTLGFMEKRPTPYETLTLPQSSCPLITYPPYPSLTWRSQS